MERVFLLERKNSCEYQILDKDRKDIGSIKLSRPPFYLQAAIFSAGFFLAALNYYVFVMMYISFRVYGLMFLSFSAGLTAFLGSFFFIFSFLRLGSAPLTAEIKIDGVSCLIRKISALGFFNLRYQFSADRPGLFELRGLIFKRLRFVNESGETLFFIRKEKGFYLFKDRDHYFGYFSYIKGGVKADLSPDLNEVITVEQALAAAVLTRR